MFENTEANWQKQFKTDGYAPIERSVPSQLDFKTLYDLYDGLVYESKTETQQVRHELSQRAMEWNNKSCNAAAYSKAPVCLRDRRDRDDKEEKTYLQYTAEFGNYVRGHSRSVLNEDDVCQSLFERLDDLISSSEKVFRSALDGLAESGNTQLRTIYPHNRPLPVIVKILAYHPNNEKATGEHSDKCVFSFVMNADDLHNDKLRIGPCMRGCSSCRMKAPVRQTAEPWSLGTGILFPGLLVQNLGIRDVKPSPHYVEPVTKGAIRHSAIAFLMAPDIDTSEIPTAMAA